MKKISLSILVCCLAIVSFSQDKREEKKERKEARRQKINELIRQAEEGVLVYQKQSIFGIQLRTNGYGAFYEYGRMKTTRKTNLYRIDFAEIKERNEEKALGTNQFFGNAYIFSKINYFYPITLGFGQQYILGQKGNKNGVAVTGIYMAGLSLGLLRPYYVTVDDPQGGGVRDIKYTISDSALFVDGSAITSGGGFGKGWGEMKMKPGAFAKIGMRFDYGRFNETVSALEIGLSADYYPGGIPIMLYEKERKLFVQGHIAILFGRRK